VKPPLFDYVAPSTVVEAVANLSKYENASILAGGQSLIPTLNFRLAAPEALIDIQHIAALKGVTIADGEIVVRAMVRQREVELDEAVHKANPLIRETLLNVAHVPIRNRGTVVGSLAHADAAAELPCLLLATGGSVVAVGQHGTRTIAADDFFKFHMTTTRTADELVTEARIPVLPPKTGWSFKEVARRHGDYALAGVCALVTLDGAGTCAEARLAACGVAARPVRLAKAEAALRGAKLDPANLSAAGMAAMDHVTAPDDTQATTAFRKRLTATLVERAVAEAVERARGRLH
jgi:carbon-monoxide dehydrogenase medium subunit